LVEEKYCFIVEWFDTQATLARKYQLLYFAIDDTIEIFDVKNKRVFLKRCKYPNVLLKDLYIGAQVTIYARPFKVLSYGDDFTAGKLEQVKGRSLALIKSSGYGQMGKIIETLNNNGFVISRMKTCKLTPQQASQFYGDNGPSDRASKLAAAPVLALEIVGAGVQQQLKDLVSSSQDAKRNGALSDIHVSQSTRTAEQEAAFFFDNPNISGTAALQDCTVAVIKPHAVSSGQTGGIIHSILSSDIEISAIELFNLDRQAAEEFLEVYKTVVPEYNAMVEQLSSGACVALELRGRDVVGVVRDLCGPPDPEIARHIRPDSLRAKFGLNKVKNSLHCTDLPEDGQLEAEFFFSILQGR